MFRLQLLYLTGYRAVIENDDDCPCQRAAFSGRAGVEELDAANLAVIRFVRMAEHGDLRPGLLRGVHERIESAVFNAVGVPMADESLHGAERDDVGVGCVGGDIAVAAHGVERYLREFLAQDRGVAGVVAEMDYQVGAAARHGLDHKRGVAVSVGKNGSFHHVFSFVIIIETAPEYNVANRSVISMKDFERIGKELERRGKTGSIKSIAESEDGQRISKMIDTEAVERAARSGDAAAMKNILGQVLGTAEGKRLAESIRRMMQD